MRSSARRQYHASLASLASEFGMGSGVSLLLLPFDIIISDDTFIYLALLCVPQRLRFAKERPVQSTGTVSGVAKPAIIY